MVWCSPLDVSQLLYVTIWMVLVNDVGDFQGFPDGQWQRTPGVFGVPIWAFGRVCAPVILVAAGIRSGVPCADCTVVVGSERTDVTHYKRDWSQSPGPGPGLSVFRFRDVTRNLDPIPLPP